MVISGDLAQHGPRCERLVGSHGRPETVRTRRYAEGWSQIRGRLKIVNHRRPQEQRPCLHRRVPSAEILLVEDDEGIGRSLSRTLEAQGFEVAWARTGLDALKRATPSTAVVVLDLGLPDLDGLEVC